MKKRKPQSQRKTMPKYLRQGSILKYNKGNLLNTFRQTKDIKLQANLPKKDLNKSNKESPKTIDYIQLMNKYSHLIEQSSDISTKQNEENNINKFSISNYYIKTDYNQHKNNNLMNVLHYNNSYKNSVNNIKANTNKFNNNDNYFQFCKTDYENNEKEEDKNNFKYYTLKSFFQNKKSSSEIYIGSNNIKKHKPNNVENNKNNNVLNSYNRNKKIKNKENNLSGGNFFNKNNNLNNKYFNNNIHNNVSLRKISKQNNSSNSHSLNNLNINRTNTYFSENKNNNFINKNISLTNEIINQKNEPNNFFNIFSEKITPFINLCRKYAKFLNNSVNHIELNHISISNNNDYFDELKYIINQYNKFIFSDKVNIFFGVNSINNSSNDTKVRKNNFINSFNLSEFEPKTLNLTEKFRNKIKDLKTQKSEINDELNLYKKRNKTLVLEKEELDLVNKKLTKENEELNNKIKNMKNLENKCYHQDNTIDKLKCQIETLNIDIKYKEKIITNLQQILEQIKIKSNLINYNNKTNDSDNIIKFNSNKNNIHKQDTKKMSLKELGNEYNINGISNASDFLLDVNSESIEKDIILPLNLKVNSIESTNTINIEEYDKKKDENNSEIFINDKKESEENILQLKKDLNSKNNININKKSNLFFSEIEEPQILTKEMEKIDQDILNLKSKLKKIISK